MKTFSTRSVTSNIGHIMTQLCWITLLTVSVLTVQTTYTDAEVCFRKYSAERNACKARVQGHLPLTVETCCSGDIQGAGYSKQWVLQSKPVSSSGSRAGGGKKWYDCIPCPVKSPSDQVVKSLLTGVSSNATNSYLSSSSGSNKNEIKDKESFSNQDFDEFENQQRLTPDGALTSYGGAMHSAAAAVAGHETKDITNDLLGGASRVRNKELKAQQQQQQHRVLSQHRSLQHQKHVSGGLPAVAAASKSSAFTAADEVWSKWTEWGPCSASCGEHGTQQRTRFCLTDRCHDGTDFEERKCVDTQPCPVDGGWSDWSDWSTCNVTCDDVTDLTSDVERQKPTGRVSRSRRCDNPKPQNGGADCIGPAIEYGPCEDLPVCPVDGRWSDWTNWTTCSMSCGEGLQTRSRQCNNPSPRHGGRPCEGLELESSPCIITPDCPVNGEWSDWSHMESCSAKPCSGQRGFRIRFRSCTKPRPSTGGLPCRGRSWIKEPCYNNDFCSEKVDGGWCLWSDWSECDGKMKTRSRNCSCPPAVNGGATCQGESVDEKPCAKSTATTTPPVFPSDTNAERAKGCHGESSGDGSDVECDMEEQEESTNPDEDGSGGQGPN